MKLTRFIALLAVLLFIGFCPAQADDPYHQSRGGGSGSGNVTGPGSPTAGQLVKWGPSGDALVDLALGVSKVACTNGSGLPVACTNLTDVAIPGSGTLSANGTPSLHQFGVWYDATHVKGVTVTGSSLVCTDSNGEPIACSSPTITTPVLTGPSYPAYASTTTGSGAQNINIDGASYSDYSYTWVTNGTACTYTPVITSAPGAGVRYVTLHVGSSGTSATINMTWTNVNFMGTAGASSVTAGKINSYACIIPASGSAKCSIIAEGSTY